jgi:hypothetical protein
VSVLDRLDRRTDEPDRREGMVERREDRIMAVTGR